MDACGTDMLCSVITQFLGALGPFELNLVKISVYIMFALSFYWSGKASSHDESFREGFINGIQYYVNIGAYNSANIPYNIDEDADKCVKEAKSRLSKHIHPKTPPKCC
jgi:hypothetical protein